jgi:hypothetical protein
MFGAYGSKTIVLSPRFNTIWVVCENAEPQNSPTKSATAKPIRGEIPNPTPFLLPNMREIEAYVTLEAQYK